MGDRSSRAWTPSRRSSPSAPRAARRPRRSPSQTPACARPTEAEPVPGGEEEREEALRQLYRWFQLYQLHHWINGFLSVLRAPSPAVPQTPQPRRRLYLPLTQNKGIFRLSSYLIE